LFLPPDDLNREDFLQSTKEFDGDQNKFLLWEINLFLDKIKIILMKTFYFLVKFLILCIFM